MRAMTWLYVVTVCVLSCTVVQQAEAVYGWYDANRPAWLDQTLTSTNGDFIMWYCDNVHHSAPFAGDPDTDGDTLPDTWETTYLAISPRIRMGTSMGMAPATGRSIRRATGPTTITFVRWTRSIPPRMRTIEI